MPCILSQPDYEGLPSACGWRGPLAARGKPAQPRPRGAKRTRPLFGRVVGRRAVTSKRSAAPGRVSGQRYLPLLGVCVAPRRLAASYLRVDPDERQVREEGRASRAERVVCACLRECVSVKGLGPLRVVCASPRERGSPPLSSRGINRAHPASSRRW